LIPASGGALMPRPPAAAIARTDTCVGIDETRARHV